MKEDRRERLSTSMRGWFIFPERAEGIRTRAVWGLALHREEGGCPPVEVASELGAADCRSSCLMTSIFSEKWKVRLQTAAVEMRRGEVGLKV